MLCQLLFGSSRISGPYGPFILAPAEDCWVGLQPIAWAFGPTTTQSMKDLGRLKGRYPENFVLISLLEVCQEGGVKKGDTWRTLQVPDMVIPDVRNDVFYPKEDILKILC